MSEASNLVTGWASGATRLYNWSKICRSSEALVLCVSVKLKKIKIKILCRYLLPLLSDVYLLTVFFPFYNEFENFVLLLRYIFSLRVAFQNSILFFTRMLFEVGEWKLFLWCWQFFTNHETPVHKYSDFLQFQAHF